MHFFKKSTALLLALVLLFTMSVAACSNQNNKDLTSNTTAQDTQQTMPREDSQMTPIIPIGFAQVYETTGTKSSLLQQKDSAPITAFEGENANRQTVYVDASQKYQSYMGYGASLTHASAYLLMQADEATRNEILYELFSRDGANLSVVRIPVGASDYIPGNTYFTCDDMPTGQTDIALLHFNLDHDADIIAIAKEIIKINPSVTFMASPWSAPAWMKSNQSLFGGALRSDMYEVYADYLLKFITEYQKEGISIKSLTLVNEPSVGKLSYPTMNMNGKEAAIITSYLGAKLEALNLNVDIVSWDYNYGSSYAASADAYLDTFYGEYAETAGKYSNTVGFHGYDGDAYWNFENNFGMKSGIQKVGQEYGKASIITEITESEVSYDFANNISWACQNIVLAPCAVQTDSAGNSWNGCSGALYWNLVLDSNGQPCPADHGVCFGVISLDSQTKDGIMTYRYAKSSAYYAMAHVSKFLYAVDGVDCYAVKATTNSNELSVLAYTRNDGAIIVVVLNTNSRVSKSVDIVIDGRMISYEIPPQSLVTFIDSEETQNPYSTYHFSTVQMKQTSASGYQFDFAVDCGGDDVQIYFTEREHITPLDKALAVTKSVSGQVASFSFSANIETGIDYFLWVVGAEKKTVLPISAPCMRTYWEKESNGLAVLYFEFENKTSHLSFCDRRGKSIYESDFSNFDTTANPIIENIDMSAKGYRYRYRADKHYYVVLTAKNGLLKIISLPKVLPKE